MQHKILLRMQCPDRPGLLAEITPYLTNLGCDIRESDIYGDAETGIFFIRMVLSSTHECDVLSEQFRPLADELAESWAMRDLNRPLKTMVAVSKFEHCLTDLLYKTSIGALPIEIKAIVSNHAQAKSMAQSYGTPFHHLPITSDTKHAQEAEMLKLFKHYECDLLALARYMQILSDDFSAKLFGRCINIHHSFLPSFKGARPYHQAHERGVKLTGATAHYVTPDLDEGPIIEQDVRRISHKATPTELVELGQEVEASVLSRAIKWHAQGRIFLNGSKTVVF